VPFHNRTLALHLVRALRANVHQVWMGEAAAMECMQNPRCIADDYVPSADPAMIPNTTVVSEKQRGPVDLWRLMVTSWVSAGAPVPRRLSKLCSSADTRSAHAPAAPSRPDMTSHATGASRSRTTRRTGVSTLWADNTSFREPQPVHAHPDRTSSPATRGCHSHTRAHATHRRSRSSANRNRKAARSSRAPSSSWGMRRTSPTLRSTGRASGSSCTTGDTT
jgi:hypothetical protein